jgi:molybdopterin-containing oxidoreductase family membrane subunit
MTIVYHITNLYFAKQWDFERFILVDGGHLTSIFWFGQIALGSILPIALLLHPTLGKQIKTVLISSALIIVGAFSQLYVLIIGGQTFPLDIFPGTKTTSTFFDGAINWYTPTLPEFLLGMGGLGVALLITTIAVRVLNFIPKDDYSHTAGDVVAD